jgi:tetratricopeptide (TPR) repeat protein
MSRFYSVLGVNLPYATFTCYAKTLFCRKSLLYENLYINYCHRGDTMKLKIVFGFLVLALLAAGCKTVPKADKSALSKNEQDVPDLVDYAGLRSVIVQAQEKRQEVVDAQLEMQNLSLVEQADASLRRAEDLYDLGENKLGKKDRNEAFTSAQSAILGYTQILDQFWLDTASDLRSKSLAAQLDALKLKADIAVREDYNLTTNIHNQGEAAYRARDYKTAMDFYTESISLYGNVSAAAAEKRRLATLALQSAEEKIAESERIAADAENVLGADADSSGTM